MKVGILAGGAGSRLPNMQVIPKPMIEIGGRPILWHILQHYAHYDLKDFVIALGYKGEFIKKYMVDYASLNSDLKVNLRTGGVIPYSDHKLDWTVELVDTGVPTMTGGRVKRLQPYLGNDTFMLTWGDSVADIDLNELLAFHQSHGKLATMTIVRPPARYGHLAFNGDQITSFSEKPQTAEGWINGAYFVLEPGIFEFIDDDETQWEKEPLQRLAQVGQLMAYKHSSFWLALDTLRDQHTLEKLWESGEAPWMIWEKQEKSKAGL